MYLRLGLMLIFTAALVAALWYRAEFLKAEGRTAQVQAELNVALDANKANAAAIARLKAENEANDILITAMSEQIEKANTQLAEANAAIKELRDKDESVRSYLSQPIPDALKRLLNN
jgi:chromosome segregation ATPase